MSSSLLNSLDELSSPPQSMLQPPSKPTTRRPKPQQRTSSSPLPPTPSTSHSSLPTPLPTPSAQSSNAPDPLSTVDTASLFPKRKRGRPRLTRQPSSPTSSLPPTTTSGTTGLTKPSSSVSKPSRRQPHNMVERKYREGLNNEMERLRAALPQLHRSRGGKLGGTGGRKDRGRIKMEDGSEDDRDDDEDMSDGEDDCDGGSGKGVGQRPSKAIVLQSAVEEIERLREENGRLREDLERTEEERDRWKGEAGEMDGFGGRR